LTGAARQTMDVTVHSAAASDFGRFFNVFGEAGAPMSIGR
jgi:hypothetical protein